MIKHLKKLHLNNVTKVCKFCGQNKKYIKEHELICHDRILFQSISNDNIENNNKIKNLLKDNNSPRTKYYFR